MYWGKIIGTLAGLATAKPLFVLLGLALGHQFDRGFAARFRPFDDRAAGAVAYGEAFVRALFLAMGHLAKIDGRVSEDEIRAARSVMHRLGLGPAQVQQAIAWFDAGKGPHFSLRPTIAELRRDGAQRPDACTLFLRLLLEVSFAKSNVGREERAAIWTICRELHIGRVDLAQLEAMVRAQKGFRRSPAGDVDSARVKAAYRALGVAQSASNEQIKTAYRRLMNKNHPDKIAASNPGDAELAEAERRTREVRSAYDLLKARRAIR